MQRFRKDPMIRQLVDYISESESCGPMIVLQTFTHFLWETRHPSESSLREIKWILKCALLGIFTVHMKGLVYADLKMENNMIGRLNRSNPNEMSGIPLSGWQTVERVSAAMSLISLYFSVIFPGSSYKTLRQGNQSHLLPIETPKFILLAQLLQVPIDFNPPGLYGSTGQVGTLEGKTQRDLNTLPLMKIVPGVYEMAGKKLRQRRQALVSVKHAKEYSLKMNNGSLPAIDTTITSDMPIKMAAKMYALRCF
ncbi:hypothetical protein MGYG_08490 [Nannizzia gypsea CBS 118893]|uniref:Protein kinase domain-containing protein n=1 Tax=Arthroderma gypseum (strain ATCC MYA-4604 / CBS 118893) TaxID=535722 RepID=E4V5V2_ARTGP|nr:hypothetical protein MGYG_08490 [Nannizzia gypsea CBS 118893]EFR05477.1 hypothetical protein MGYG_08490 [Nannizzia gypsea CBS 118893]